MVMSRAAARRWNAGDKFGLQTLKMDHLQKNWHCEPHGKHVHKLLRLRNLIMDGIRRFGLHPSQEDTPPYKRDI